MRGGSDRALSRPRQPGWVKPTGSSIWAKSPCDSPTMATPGRCSSNASRSRATSDTWRPTASASGIWASLRWPPATSTARESASFARSRFAKETEDKRNEAIALWCLGKVDAAGGDRESARAKFAEALRAFESFQMSSEALDCLEDFAALMQESGRSGDAARVHAATVAIRDRLTIPRLQRGESRRLKSIESACEALGRNGLRGSLGGRHHVGARRRDRVRARLCRRPHGHRVKSGTTSA